MKSYPLSFGLLLLLALGLFCQHANAQHPNILVGDQDAPNEPSICINPKNTQQLVAGANLDNVYYSHDGGNSWTRTPVTCPWNIWGDPVMSVDTAGAFYFLHLSNPPENEGSWVDRIIAQKSADGGVTWSPGSYTGLNGAKVQDKHWIATDWHSNQLYVSWTQFDVYNSSVPTDSSIILFSTSTDAGNSWSEPKRLSTEGGDCLDSDLTAEGAMPCVGPEGQVYVAWANRNKIWFDRSLDKGNTWLQDDVFVSDQPGGWDYSIPGIFRANGLPVTACDTSHGPNRGTIYINWTDQRNGEDDTDVWLVKSTDGGATWSEAKRVNDDPPGHQQFFTWMTLDQATGWLWFVFYDRRNYNDEQTDVYMAVSKDGGETFINFQVSESPFFPVSDFFFGDYTNVTAYNNVVRPIWARLDVDQLTVWTAIVHPEAIFPPVKTHELESKFSLDNPAPNPAVDVAGFSFKLHHRALVSLKLIDFQGVVRTVLIDEDWRNPGKHLEKIDLKQLGLQPGAYFFVLSVDGKVARKKLVVI